MADFCRQCAIETFGMDAGDLRGLNKTSDIPLDDLSGFPTLCEGCGYAFVDHMGQCLGGCLNSKHEVVERKFNTWGEVEEELSKPDSPFQYREPTP